MTLSAWKTSERVAGMRLFTIGLLSLSFGALTGIARIVVHGNAIVALSNVFMLGGMITVAQSIRIFRGVSPLPRAAVIGISAAASVLYFWWMFGQDNFAMRVAVISGSFALLSIDAARSMLRRVPAQDRMIYWPTGFGFAFASAYLTMRTAGALLGSYAAGLWSPVPIELASTVCANVAFIGCAFGMLIASNAHLRRDTEKMALIDSLTNLPNRRSFSERLLEAEERAFSTNRQFGLIYLDLDEFKQVNDMLGHDAGDDLLRRISAAMARMLRSGDCLGRIGGDEFVVLVEDARSRAEVEGLAGRLKAAVEREAFSADISAPVRVSHGVALFPENGCSAHDAMRQADAAMYRAKQRSRMLDKNSAPGFAPFPGQNECAVGQSTANTAVAGTFQRRRSDRSRTSRPSTKPNADSPRFSWSNPLSWIGY
jgi:diguanylate cyclase (GGDEF)-like protein